MIWYIKYFNKVISSSSLIEIVFVNNNLTFKFGFLFFLWVEELKIKEDKRINKINKKNKNNVYNKLLNLILL